MTVHARPFGFLLTDSLLRAARRGTIAGLVTAAVAGCSAKPVCTEDSDCGPGYLCIDNERCVLDPTSDAGTPGVDAGTDAGVDASPEGEPSSCNSNTDMFNPDEVHILGSLSGITCEPNAITSLGAIEDESVGFPCGIEGHSAAIRPNGTLVYLDTDTQRVLEFDRDVPPFIEEIDGCVYPIEPEGNDTEIPTTSCDNSGGTVAFLLGPEDPGAWYTCGNTSGQWFDEKHELIGFLGGSDPLVRGFDGWVLARSSEATGGLLELYDEFGLQHDLTGVALEGDVLAVRALDDGIRVVVEGDGEGSGELLVIGLDGGATSAGAYPSLPAGVTVAEIDGGRALDATGALYVAAVDGQQNDVVIKLTAGANGEASEVYSEADGTSEVSMKSAALVTGL